MHSFYPPIIHGGMGFGFVCMFLLITCPERGTNLNKHLERSLLARNFGFLLP